LPCRPICTADNAARLFGALNETPWAAHAKLVLMTAEGLAPPQFAYDLMRPLTPLSMETWADFTNRLPSAEVRQ
jgi:RecB family exonuclease